MSSEDDAPPGSSEVANSYCGFRLGGDNWIKREHIPRCASDFFDVFVKARRPVILSGDAAAAACAGLDKGLLRDPIARLREVASGTEVEVEIRSNADSVYGSVFNSGVRRTSMGEFLDSLKQGNNDKGYMTSSQPMSEVAPGVPGLISPPLLPLAKAGTLPIRPSVLPTLVPSSINIWVGALKPGASSSSGLHHDFHDNLYLLVAGKKRFRLYSPADAGRLQVGGTMVAVHPNGRPNYAGMETAPDGRVEVEHLHHINMDDAITSSSFIDRLLSIKTTNRTVKAHLRELIARVHSLECAERLALVDTIGQLDPEDIPILLDTLSSFEPNLQPLVNDELSLDIGLLQWPITVRALLDRLDEGRRFCKRRRQSTGTQPINFSTLPQELVTAGPASGGKLTEYNKCTQQLIDLFPGDMLYLPAGWFHEVTSEPPNDGSGSEHVAVNWWFHPPDGTKFAEPYSSSYFENDFQGRKLSWVA